MNDTNAADKLSAIRARLATLVSRHEAEYGPCADGVGVDAAGEAISGADDEPAPTCIGHALGGVSTRGSRVQAVAPESSGAGLEGSDLAVASPSPDLSAAGGAAPVTTGDCADAASSIPPAADGPSSGGQPIRGLALELALHAHIARHLRQGQAQARRPDRRVSRMQLGPAGPGCWVGSSSRFDGWAFDEALDLPLADAGHSLVRVWRRLLGWCPVSAPLSIHPEHVPTTAEEAARTFACASMRLRVITGAGCARQAKRCQLNPMAGPGADICAACPAGAARMMLLGLGTPIRREVVGRVLAERVDDGGGWVRADGVCGRCASRPAMNRGGLYGRFCAECLADARAAIKAEGSGQAACGKSQAYRIRDWLEAGHRAPRAPRVFKKQSPGWTPKKPQAPKCSGCGCRRDAVTRDAERAGRPDLCRRCLRKDKGPRYLERHGSCACGAVLESIVPRDYDLDLCRECHRRAMDRRKYASEAAGVRRLRPIPPAVAAVLSIIAEGRAAGLSWAAIAKRVNAAGMPTERSGKPWTAGGVRNAYCRHAWRMSSPAVAA